MTQRRVDFLYTK